jgi:bifunctional polynucleotide phosphatase/kinase
MGLLARLAGTCNIVIITNRSSGEPAALDPVREYVAELDARMGRAGVTVYAARARDRDRKPHTGAWEHYVAHALGGVPPSFAFYCGDAAGRPGDHSAVDYMFALNIGVAFVTPEAAFGGGRGYTDPWADPEAYGCTATPPAGWPAQGEVAAFRPSRGAERGAIEWPAASVVIMLGGPASGKTRLAAELVASHGFRLASADAQGARHKRVFTEAVAAGARVVVDNTNPRASDRRAYAEGARGAPLHIWHVTTPKAVCFFLNAARCQLDATGKTKELPPVALHTYWKRLEAPDEKEAQALGATLTEIPFTLGADAPPEVTRFRYPLR